MCNAQPCKLKRRPRHATDKNEGHAGGKWVYFMCGMFFSCSRLRRNRRSCFDFCSFSSPILCMCPFINHHLGFLDGMKEHGGQTHAALASQLMLLATIIVDAETEPAAPEIR